MKNLSVFLFAISFLYSQSNQLEPTAISTPPISLEAQPSVPLLEPPHKSPLLATALSSIIPGLGHAYLEDMNTAGILIASAAGGQGIASIPHGEELIRVSGRMTFQTAYFYGIYAAYRDARLYNRNVGDRYPMPTDHFPDLLYAPFNWGVLKKPEVWGGFLGSLAIVLGAAYFLYDGDAQIHLTAASSPELSPFIAFPVGISEEALFRGCLQSLLIEATSPWGGILVSSLAFGAAHIPNAFQLDHDGYLLMDRKERKRYFTVSLPLITGFGAYFGWLTYKNRSLKESVALHTWYDFTLLSLKALAQHAAVTGRPGFSLSIPF